MSLSIHTEKMDPVLQDQYPRNLKCDCGKHKSDRPRRRRLVVAFDGTQKQFGDKSSHVVEFYSRIVKSDDQLSFYTSGIGTFIRPSSKTKLIQRSIKNKWVSAVGHNFTSNILAGYRFLSEKYKSGDQIFLLGFSRGAYQARVLAAMITKVGLLRTGNNEQIPFAFSMYADPKASKLRPINSDHTEQGETTTAKEFKKAFCNDVNIHFLGVWDTVSSTRPFLNVYYPGAELAENICFFRHALALDERRVKFIPEYIFAKKEFFLPGEFGPPRCKEVWFRGCHSDIGGGKAKNITSDNGAIPSRWMAYEAMLAGLEMTPFRKIGVKDLRPKIGKYSMARLYTILEYMFLFVKWENHSDSKGRSPLLEGSRTSEKPRADDDFSRTWHRKRPRQIYDHQKLHLSVCMHTDEDSLKIPSAHPPASWGNDSDWTWIVKLHRKPEAGSSFDSRQPRNRFVGVERDIMDCDAIPALIAGVLRGTNVNEFLDRLRVITLHEKGKQKVREDSDNIREFSSMLQQSYSDERYPKHTDLAIWAAYNVFYEPEVDLYASDEKLWNAILSMVERWNRSQTDSDSNDSLHRAGQLLHHTQTEKAFVKIKHALIRMFDQWQQSFTKPSSAPVQLRFLLRTAVERDARDDILRLSVLSSPHFLDADFKEMLLERLVYTLDTTGGENIKLAMLYFCVLCAFDEKVILHRESFDRLKAKFVELETPTKEMWELVLRQPQISNSDGSVGLSGGRETKKELKKLLQDDRIKETFQEGDLSWARRALDKPLNPQPVDLLALAQVSTVERREEQPSSRA